MSPYRVDSVDANDMHDEKPYYFPEGAFDTPEEALACAQAVVRRSVAEHLLDGGMADRAYRLYCLYGAIPMIWDSHGDFNPYDYARRHLEETTGERVSGWV